MGLPRLLLQQNARPVGTRNSPLPSSTGGDRGFEAFCTLGRVFLSHLELPPPLLQGQGISLGTWNLPESGESAEKHTTEWETEACDCEQKLGEEGCSRRVWALSAASACAPESARCWTAFIL